MTINKKLSTELKKRNKEESDEEFGFEVHGQVIHTFAKAPATWLLDLSEIERSPAALRDAIMKIIVPEDRVKFQEILDSDDPSKFIDVDFLTGLIGWLAQEYTGSPLAEA